MTTRADTYTQTQKIKDLFSDFLDDLTPHPITRDISRVRNEQSIKQALKNLILTNYGERPFQPQIGSDIRSSLFEPNDDVVAEDLQYKIEKTIEINEPRVRLVDLIVAPFPEQDKIAITITFVIINTQQLQQLDLLLRRVR